MCYVDEHELSDYCMREIYMYVGTGNEILEPVCCCLAGSTVGG